MSKDIRSFFQVKKPQKPKTQIEDDDDEIPESPDVQIKNKKKDSKRRRVLKDSDSEEEIFATKKKKNHNETEKNKSKNKAPPKPVLKEVKAVDIFGSAPIKRSEPLIKKKKITETGIHSDEEFEKSLLEIDNAELESSQTNKNHENEKSPKKTENTSTKHETEPKHNSEKHENEKLSKTEKPSTSKDITVGTNESNKHDSSNSEKKNKHHDSDKSDSKKEIKTHKNIKDSKESHKSHSHKEDKKTKTASDKDSKDGHSEGGHSSKDGHSKGGHSSKDGHSKGGHSSKDGHSKGGHSSKGVGDVALKENKKSKDQETKPLGIKEQVKLDNKRKFSEFVENDTSQEHDSGKKKKLESHKPENKDQSMTNDYTDSSIVEDHEDKRKSKKKFNKSLNESVLSDEERHERKRHSAALYQKYLNRSGPKQLGAKEIPEGTPNCLKDCAFVLTGVLDSFENDEIAKAITKFGGCVKSGVTKKVTHVLAGEDAGPSKMAKAQELGIKIINEDEFLKMIVDLSQNKNNPKAESKKEIKKERSPRRQIKKERSPKPEAKKDNKKEKSPVKKSSKDKSPKDKSAKHNHDYKSKTSISDKLESKLSHYSKHKIDTDSKVKDEKSKSPKKIKETKSEPENEIKSEASCNATTTNGIDKSNYAYMWVDKYKPQTVKQIIGQHGDASNVKKLTSWLTKWYVNRKAKLAKPSPWAKNDDGGYFKAALLSGPPGVGKTTTVALVCKELGFDAVEFNASDTRNKSLIKEQIGELLTSTSLSAYAKGDTGKQAVTKKHVLVMDEVDGMAGNEDRGGLQELISLIKSASVPIICMCNDRNSQKMRSLVNYCYDLRFSRPRVDQIKSAMMSICFKEGIKIPPDVLSQLIVSSNQDVRQTLNLLSMWAADPNIADAERLRKDAKITKKDVKLGPWEAIRKVFSAEEHKTMSINDKSDLFFYDYSLSPLFVQENYLQVQPHCPKHEVLQRISGAADSISLGDLVDARIRRSQAWSLLPIQAMYSSVIPGTALSGHVAGQVQFPGWLGKNSRASKMHRLCQEIHAHTRLTTSGSKSSIFLDYCTHLRDAIVNPLIQDKADGISQSLEVLESYHLLREDLDSLVELSLWPQQRNPTVLIDAKVKAAMTRTYNKKATALPYAPGAVKRGRTKDSEENGEEEEIEEEEPEDSDPENDALIKKKKGKDSEKPSTSKQSKTTSKPASSKEKKKK